MAMNYSDKVMEHFTNPQNVGEIENASGCGTVGNAVCGDIMRVYLDIDENNVIQDAKFKTFGCGAAIATSSMATVLVKGKTVQEALKVTNKAVMEALDGLPPVRCTARFWPRRPSMRRCGTTPRRTASSSRAGEARERHLRARPRPRRRGRRISHHRLSSKYGSGSEAQELPSLSSRPARAGKSLDSRPQRR